MDSTHLDPTTRDRLNSLDRRYRERAYAFVLTALEDVVRRLPERRHVSGGELAEGCRELALRLYGPMAKTVLEHWNIRSTRDFGEIVFNLIDIGQMKKTDHDRREDFENVFDFDDAFRPQYPPRNSAN